MARYYRRRRYPRYKRRRYTRPSLSYRKRRYRWNSRYAVRKWFNKRASIYHTLCAANRIGGPFPSVLNTKLKYTAHHKNVATTLGNGYYDSHSWAMNSLYDPDVTGAGNQPLLYDKLFGGSDAPYKAYRVNACKIKITWHPDFDVGAYYYIGVFAMNSTAALATNTSTDMRTLPFSKQSIIDPQLTYSKTPHHTVFTRVKSFVPGEYKSVNYTAHYNANPASMLYYRVYAHGIDSSIEVTVYYDVKITYYCTCYDRDQPVDDD